MHSGWANKAVQLTPFSLPRERAMPLWPNCSAKVRGSPLRCPVLSVWHTSEHHFPPWGVHYSNWHREQVAPTQWSQRGQGERDSTSLKQQLCSRGRLLRTHNHTHREDKTDTLTQTSMLYVPTISVQRKGGYCLYFYVHAMQKKYIVIREGKTCIWNATPFCDKRERVLTGAALWRGRLLFSLAAAKVVKTAPSCTLTLTVKNKKSALGELIKKKDICLLQATLWGRCCQLEKPKQLNVAVWFFPMGYQTHCRERRHASLFQRLKRIQASHKSNANAQLHNTCYENGWEILWITQVSLLGKKITITYFEFQVLCPCKV